MGSLACLSNCNFFEINCKQFRSLFHTSHKLYSWENLMFWKKGLDFYVLKLSQDIGILKSLLINWAQIFVKLYKDQVVDVI